MRRFSNLTREQVQHIYASFLSEEPKLSIARRLHVDNSTVHYHINKIKHLPRVQIIALIAPKCERGCDLTGFWDQAEREATARLMVG